MTREEIEKSIKCCNPYDENCGDCLFNDLPLGKCFESLAKSSFNILLEDREKLQKQVDELETMNGQAMAYIESLEYELKQAVKDTAKEILITAIQLSDMCSDFYEFQNRLVDLIEANYGIKIIRETIIPAKGVEVQNG